MLTIFALAFASFFVIVGALIDEFRREWIDRPYVALDIIDWKELPFKAAAFSDNLLNKIFGNELFSGKVLSKIMMISISINGAILLCYVLIFVVGHIELYVMHFYIYTVFLALTLGALHDCISIIITRYLIRIFLKRAAAWKLLVDVILAFFLWKSTLVIMGQSASYANLGGNIAELKGFTSLEWFFSKIVSDLIWLSTLIFKD